jgi:signal transduction histidine kinase
MTEILFIAAAVVSLATGLTVLLVNPQRPINRIFFGGSILSLLWFVCLAITVRIGNRVVQEIPSSELLLWLRASSAVPAFLVALVAFLGAQLEEEITSYATLLRKTWPWIALSCVMAALAFTDSFIPAYSTPSLRHRGTAYLVFMGLAAFAGVWAIGRSLLQARRLSGVRKLEAQFFVFNLAAAALLVLTCNLAATAYPNHNWLRRLGPIWVCVWQAVTVWSISYYRVFDARQVLLSVMQRLLLLGTVGMLALLLCKILRGIVGLWPSVALASAAACGFGLIIDRPMRRWLRLDLVETRRLARSEIVAWARQAGGGEELRQRFEVLLRQLFSAQRVSLLLLRGGLFVRDNLAISASWEGLNRVCQDGWVTPESLQRRRVTPAATLCKDLLAVNRLGALIAAPKESPTPSLLIALGQKDSLRPFTYPEIVLILELAELMDNILTHAHVAARNAEIERMESAAMMSRGLAHDLNNLATPVSSFLVHMEGKVAPGTPEAEVLADARHSIQVMQDYIRESLFYSRQLVPDFQAVSSTELFAATIQSTQSRARSAAVDLTAVPGPDVSFAADRVLLLRLLQNLVVNGIDATPPGGRVTLFAAAVDGDRVALAVADDGPGVPPDIVDRIFEPYFTTKDTGSKTRGLGLGLAISLKIGALHGGTIQVGRAPSGGALFTLSLPRSHPRPP